MGRKVCPSNWFLEVGRTACLTAITTTVRPAAYVAFAQYGDFPCLAFAVRSDTIFQYYFSWYEILSTILCSLVFDSRHVTTKEY